MTDLERYRDEIDEIDSEIVRLFEKRMKVSEEVAEYKIKTENIVGTGISVPGPVDDTGLVRGCVNIGWGYKKVGEELEKLKTEREEKEWEKLWKTFFTTIAIEQRKNLDCQRNHLPLRFRPLMTEFAAVQPCGDLEPKVR